MGLNPMKVPLCCLSFCLQFNGSLLLLLSLPRSGHGGLLASLCMSRSRDALSCAFILIKSGTRGLFPQSRDAAFIEREDFSDN